MLNCSLECVEIMGGKYGGMGEDWVLSVAPFQGPNCMANAIVFMAVTTSVIRDSWSFCTAWQTPWHVWWSPHLFDYIFSLLFSLWWAP